MALTGRSAEPTHSAAPSYVLWILPSWGAEILLGLGDFDSKKLVMNKKLAVFGN